MSAEIDKLITACYKNTTINGAVLVAENGKVIYKKAMGIANVDWDIPVDTETRFNIYSISKQFTATLAMVLVEEGKLKLDGTISDYLPYFRKDTGGKVTIHQLMSHTHGLPRLDYPTLPPLSLLSTEEWIKKHFSKDLEFEPGSNFKYGNGLDVLAAIIEQVTGKSHEQFMMEKIFKPLNMKNTGFIHVEQNIKKRATAYWETLKKKRIEVTEHPANGSNGLYSTLDDLLLWHKALQHNRVISKESTASMFTRHAAFGRNYGYAFDLVELPLGKKKKKFVFHGGGGKTMIFRSLEEDRVVILLNNFVTQCFPVSYQIVNILEGLPYTIVKRGVLGPLFEALKVKPIDEVVALYYRLKKEEFDKWSFDERQLNRLGYFLLNTKRFDRAIGIFKVNVAEFPKSANAYDSLAEAYMKKGDKTQAKENFRKSLELNPKNENAVKMLEKLKE
ncbi:MAG: serine hydrolase [bacterium]|nr:serine hydrolase [bacterium]